MSKESTTPDPVALIGRTLEGAGKIAQLTYYNDQQQALKAVGRAD
jgi:hypothetical protein